MADSQAPDNDAARYADRLAEAAAKLKAAAEADERAASLRREAEALVPGILSRLHIADESITSELHMPVESVSAGRSHAQFEGENAEHPFVKMLVRRGLAVPDIVAALTKRLKREIPRSTVQSWYRELGHVSYRPIPEDAANALKEDFGVSLSAWPRIRKPKK